MLPWLGERFGNASSRHEYGRAARKAIDEARAQVAAAVNAHPTEVIFTSGGSEANNLFIKGAAAVQKPGLVAVSAVEHPCVREPARQLVERLALRRDRGRLKAGSTSPPLRVAADKPKLVSVMLANNETGVLQDVPRWQPRSGPAAAGCTATRCRRWARSRWISGAWACMASACRPTRFKARWGPGR
jgi:cysteine desulfurase